MEAWKGVGLALQALPRFAVQVRVEEVFEKQLEHWGSSQRLGWRQAVITMIFNQGHVPSSYNFIYFFWHHIRGDCYTVLQRGRLIEAICSGSQLVTCH